VTSEQNRTLSVQASGQVAMLETGTRRLQRPIGTPPVRAGNRRIVAECRGQYCSDAVCRSTYGAIRGKCKGSVIAQGSPVRRRKLLHPVAANALTVLKSQRLRPRSESGYSFKRRATATRCANSAHRRSAAFSTKAAKAPSPLAGAINSSPPPTVFHVAAVATGRGLRFMRLPRVTGLS
jgi:hypothetical protein